MKITMFISAIAAATVLNISLAFAAPPSSTKPEPEADPNSQDRLTAKGLIRILSNATVARTLENHSIESLDVGTIDSRHARGFVVLVEATAPQPSPKGTVLMPCFVSIAAARPIQNPKAPYTITTRELCVSDQEAGPPLEERSRKPPAEIKTI